eukprot:gene8307-11239_t
MESEEEDNQSEDYDNQDYEYYYEEDGDSNDVNMDNDSHQKADMSIIHCGMRYDGVLAEAVQSTEKRIINSIYKQLAEFCVVDVAENFMSASIVIYSNNQEIFSTIAFPISEPFFPSAPPKITVESKFRKPNERYNVIFNCHPLLLKNRWNICCDISQIYRDIQEIGKHSVVDGLLDSESVIKQVIDLINLNELNISEIFHDNIYIDLPSFGVFSKSENVKKSSGTGYSTGRGSSNLNWSLPANVSNSIVLLQNIVQSNHGIDSVEVDCIHLILSDFVGHTSISLEEFFRNIKFYEAIISVLIKLPLTVETVCLDIFHSFNGIQISNDIRNSLEPHERVAVDLLDRLITSHNKKRTIISLTSDNSADQSESNSYNYKEIKTLDNNNDKINNSVSISSVDSPVTAHVASYLNNSSLSDKTSVQESLQASEINKKIVELDVPFTQHKYLTDMTAASAGTLSSKWFRRLRIELSTMEESLPNNVIVFTGMNVSQPNLLRIAMFPESLDSPYCGGCFLFDVFIPLEYPLSPPKVNIITTGEGSVRFNPNLYACGKVCLSLLGTWEGEKWNSEFSNLTQVINSILFLIFVEEPYFNEPGYEATRGNPYGNARSIVYNQNIQRHTLTCAYLDHFNNSSSERMRLKHYIIPRLIENWNRMGKSCALRWMDGNPNAKAIERLISEIDGKIQNIVT